VSLSHENTILNRKQNYDYTKRIFDLAIAISLLIILLPVFAVVGFMVRISLGTPVFFCQLRPGKNGKPFVIYKFRTMTDERGKDGNLISDADRIKSVGYFLRMMSLDELPALWNVIKGEMSLVGPRPMLMQYLDYYTLEQARRHEVNPGVTGWASIHGRNNTLFSKRFAMDVWYVDNRSFLLDMRILLATFFKVLKHEGAIVGQDVKEIDDINLFENSLNKKRRGK